MLDYVEQHQCRAARRAIASLPIPQRGGGEAEAGGELLLSHAYFGAHRFYIDFSRAVHTRATRIAFGMDDRFLSILTCLRKMDGLKLERGCLIGFH